MEKRRPLRTMPAGKALCRLLLAVIAFLATIERMPHVQSMPLREDATEDIITGSEFLSVLIGSDPKDEYSINDINKKEAPRISTVNEEDIFNADPHETINRSSRSSNKDELNSLKIDLIATKKDYDDLQPAGSSFYSENTARLKNNFPSSNPQQYDDDDVPKIIGVRVTSSVAIGRGNKNPQLVQKIQDANIPSDDNPKMKSDYINRSPNDSPTTWRPPLYRFINRDYYKAVPSNRHTVSTLPGSLIGANEDYIQQQKERDMNKKKSNILHPYQRAISYGPSRENHRPRAYSYSSLINTFGDTKLTTINDWSSTKSEPVATEATAGYVTIINHNGDNSVDEVKEPEQDIKALNPLKQLEIDTSSQSVPPLPIVYSEPAKIYSEPAKVYGKQEKIYSEPAKIYSEPAKNYGEPSKVYSEPAKIYSEPAKIYSEPAKIYSEPAKIYSQPSAVYHSLPKQQESRVGLDVSDYRKIFDEAKQPSNPNERPMTTNDTKDVDRAQGRSRGSAEKNYEIDESISVMTNGRTHGVQDKAADDNQKVGYVVEGRNYKKYRVEERTPDGFIVGEYGVVSHDDGSLRGVRYTADGTTNPRLIYDALMKFLSL